MTDEPRNGVNIENLIVSHFDGSLAEEQEKELAEVLKTSWAEKQLFLSYMRMEGRLHSLGRDGFLREPVAEPAIEAERPSPQSADVAPLARSGRQRLRLFAASSLAVCAAMMLMLLSGLLWTTSASASSVLHRAQQSAAELIDRTYRVTLSGVGERSSTSELTINVRGGGRFLVRPVDGAYVMGSDGTEYWVTQQSGPVWVARDSRSLVPKLKQLIPNTWLLGIAANPDEPLLLDMAGVLSLIEHNRDLELIKPTNPREHHVRATLRLGRPNSPPNVPERIDFWADAESGVGLRAEVRWADGRQMRFELIESPTFSDQWYHYRAHVPDRSAESLDTR